MSDYNEQLSKFYSAIANNDYTDYYDPDEQLSRAIASGLKYRFIYHHRSMSIEDINALFALFSKYYDRLPNAIDDYDLCISQQTKEYISMAMHGWNNYNGNIWLIQMYMRGFCTGHEYLLEHIQKGLAYENTNAVRNEIQLKLLANDVLKYREMQSQLKENNMLAKDMSDYLHLFKYIIKSSSKEKSNKQYKKYIIVIDEYNESLFLSSVNDHTLTTPSMCPLYDCIMNDALDIFQKWFINGGLTEFVNRPFIDSFNAKSSIAECIRRAGCEKIMKFLIMNNELLSQEREYTSPLDPWQFAINDPKLYTLMKQYYTEEHISLLRKVQNPLRYFCIGFYIREHVLRHANMGIIENIWHDLHSLWIHANGKPMHVLFSYMIAIVFVKYGHLFILDFIDVNALRNAIMNESEMHKYPDYIHLVTRFIEFSYPMTNDDFPFGISTSIAIYIRNWLHANGIAYNGID